MTIHRIKGRIHIECDLCGEIAEGGTFDQTWREAKQEGWRTKCFCGAIWNHYCPTCEIPETKANLDTITKGLL